VRRDHLLDGSAVRPRRGKGDAALMAESRQQQHHRVRQQKRETEPASMGFEGRQARHEEVYLLPKRFKERLTATL
jgi:hypothetical protein